MSLVQEKLAQYVATPYGLNYKPSDVNCDPSRQDEVLYIAQHLCGGANKELAIAFMINSRDETNTKLFFENVSFNGANSDKVIVRAIQIHLQNS